MMPMSSKFWSAERLDSTVPTIHFHERPLSGKLICQSPSCLRFSGPTLIGANPLECIAPKARVGRGSAFWSL